MGIRWKLTENPVSAGALIGALAAFIVAAAGHLDQWMNSDAGSLASGATQGLDQWTYYSMARAVWRSPNGITYSYPYDLYWPMPAVAFQLPITMIAWLGRLTGLPVAFEIARLAGAAGAGAALAAIGLHFRRGFWRRWFYIAAALGGGFFSLRAACLAVDTAGVAGLTEIWQYQPKAQGKLFWWLPFLSPNLRMPLECIYHALVMGALACIAWRRYWSAWALGAMAWASNPFAAVALHAAVLPWYLWRVAETRGTRRTGFTIQLAAWLAVNLLAVAYYGWFLNQWEVMRELGRLYRIQYVPALDITRLTLLLLPFGAGIVASVCIRSIRRAVWENPVFRLFGLLSIVHIALLQQSAVLGEKSMQSYHYNRGYLHLGLAVVAWRAVTVIATQRGCYKVSATSWLPSRLSFRRCQAFAVVVIGLVTISCLDQVLFWAYAISRTGADGLVRADYVKLARMIPAEPAPMLVYTEPLVLNSSYISAFTPHIAWQATETMVVPFPDLRAELYRSALQKEGNAVAELGIDYAIIAKSNSEDLASLTGQGWLTITDSSHLILLRAPEPIAGQNPTGQ